MKRYVLLALILSILLSIGWKIYLGRVREKWEKMQEEAQQATTTSRVVPERFPEIGDLWILP